MHGAASNDFVQQEGGTMEVTAQQSRNRRTSNHVTTKRTKVAKSSHNNHLKLRGLRVLRGEDYPCFLVAASPRWDLRGEISSA
jgi:hypothetical protein